MILLNCQWKDHVPCTHNANYSCDRDRLKARKLHIHAFTLESGSFFGVCLSVGSIVIGHSEDTIKAMPPLPYRPGAWIDVATCYTLA